MEATEQSSGDVTGIETVLDLLDSASAAVSNSSSGTIVPDVVLSYTDVLLIRTCLRETKNRLLVSDRLRRLPSEEKSTSSRCQATVDIRYESDALKSVIAESAADKATLASARQSATHRSSVAACVDDFNRSPEDDLDDDDLECDSCVYIATSECVCEDDKATGGTEAARVDAATLDDGCNVAISSHRALTDRRYAPVHCDVDQPVHCDADQSPNTSDASLPVSSFGCQTDLDVATSSLASAVGAGPHRNGGFAPSVLVDKLMSQNMRLKKALRDLASRQFGSTQGYLVSES
jgi:hypothetical protein